MKSKRTLVAVTTSAAAAAAGVAMALLRKPVPAQEGTITLPGLTSVVEVLTDQRGFAHLYAEHESDLFRAQGYVMAQERLFQMDFLRRFAAGRLSELAGEETLDIDRWQRVLGLRRSAEKAWPHTGEEAKEALVAFSAGVNAAMDEMKAGGRWPVEFRLIGGEPERWTPVDSLSILRLLALSLSVGWEADLLREAMRNMLGEEAAGAAFPTPPVTTPVISSPGLAALKGMAAGVTAGSNCWAVDGTRTESGKPLLAADPHLALRLPPLWWMAHLHCPTLHVAGCALSGVPGIVLGHNEHGAWGITAGYADVQDLYIEERLSLPDGRTAFRWGDLALPATILEERITVRGRAEPVAQSVIISRHGPLISELLPDERRDLALRWTIDEPDDAMGATLSANRATSWDDFRQALAGFGSPPLNFTWAGHDGVIGWIQAGRIPIRQGERGLAPMDGAVGDNEWLGYIPQEELPQQSSPAAGYLVHANNRPAGEDFPHWLGIDFLPGYRAARISELLEARATHSAATFQAMQADLYSYPEHRLARCVSSLPSLTGDLRVAQRLLASWDGQMAVNSVGAAIAHICFHQLRHGLVSDELGSWAARWEGKANQIELQNVLPHGVNSWAWVVERLDDPDHPWWRQAGTGRRYSRDERIIEALEQTVTQLRERLGDDPKRWTWGRLHQRVIEHPMGALPVLGRLFRRGPFPMPGSAFTINADLGTVHQYQPMPLIGSSARLIADLSDWDRFLVALPGGNSGHPASRHFTSGLAGWRAGQLEPFAWSRQAVEKDAAGKRRLQPA